MSRFRRWGKVLVYLGVGVLVLACCLGLPCIVQKIPDDSGGRPLSVFNLKGIGVAMHSYHDAFKKLPPAVVTDEAGRPLYSWRVLLLPFLEQQDLYRQFKLGEPWDSPHNKKLLKETPWCYSLRGLGDDPAGTTRYQVFVGPGTTFERPGLTLKDEFPDGLGDTLLVVEAGRAVPWSKPDDLTYDPKGPLPSLGGLFSQPVHFVCYEVSRRPGFNACFADVTVLFIRSDTDEQTLRALITRNGGEKVDLSRLR